MPNDTIDKAISNLRKQISDTEYQLLQLNSQLDHLLEAREVQFETTFYHLWAGKRGIYNQYQGVYSVNFYDGTSKTFDTKEAACKDAGVFDELEDKSR